jgi:AcrR family transcriptional regulator
MPPHLPGMDVGIHHKQDCVYDVRMLTVSTADRIAEVARRILVEKGSAEVTMRQVASAAGVSAMAIYRHFPNREPMLQTVADGAFAELAERWNAKPRSEAADVRPHEILEDHLDFALDQPRLYDYMFIERRDQARQFPEDFRARRSPTFTILADAVADGVRQGIFRDTDVWETSLMLAALTHGLVQLYHGERIGMSEADFRALCHAFACRMIDALRS